MPFLVSNLLQLTIPLNDGRVLFAIPSPVVRIAGAPLLRTIQAFLPVDRVRSDLLAVIIGAATPLAVGLTAYRLPRLILRWLEDHLTVAAAPFDHTGGCRTAEASVSDGRFRNCCRVHTASPPMSSSTTTKPGKLRSIYSGADSKSGSSMIQTDTPANPSGWSDSLRPRPCRKGDTLCVKPPTVG